MEWTVDEKLEPSRGQMRELGYRIVDTVVEHFAGLAFRKVSRTASRESLERALWEPLPRAPRSPEEVLKRVKEDVLDNIIHVDHPRYFGFVPGPSNYVGVLGDFLAAGFNVFAGTWLEGSGPAEVELVTLDWLKELIGYPDEASGLFVSGGSAANLTALMIAREQRLSGGIGDGVAYCSTQTHSSLLRAFRVLGFRSQQVRRLGTDAEFRLSIEELEREVAFDRREGRRPFAVVANAGTTNTGAVDPLKELREFCRDQGLWLHADGAYGAIGALSQRQAHLLEGLGNVDSVSLDPHKWLFQPYEIGCVLVREGRLLAEHFRVDPEYLEDVRARENEVNFCDRGIQLTRSFRALKLWMTLQLFGVDNIRRAVDHGIEMAERAQALLDAREEFEVTSRARLGVVSFRYLPPRGAHDVDGLHRRLVRAVIEDGFSLVSSTVLDGRTVIRMCPINPRTTEADLEQTIERIAAIAENLA